MRRLYPWVAIALGVLRVALLLALALAWLQVRDRLLVAGWSAAVPMLTLMAAGLGLAAGLHALRLRLAPGRVAARTDLWLSPAILGVAALLHPALGGWLAVAAQVTPAAVWVAAGLVAWAALIGLRYNVLRRYSDDPCETVPDGHDPEMCRRHNGCG